MYRTFYSGTQNIIVFYELLRCPMNYYKDDELNYGFVINFISFKIALKKCLPLLVTATSYTRVWNIMVSLKRMALVRHLYLLKSQLALTNNSKAGTASSDLACRGSGSTSTTLRRTICLPGAEVCVAWLAFRCITEPGKLTLASPIGRCDVVTIDCVSSVASRDG